MSENKYVIDGYYDFGTVTDGARPTASGDTGIHLRFEHDDVMEMGKYFYEEDPKEMDYDYNFGIKEILDNILVDKLVAELEKEWEEEQNGSGEDDDDEWLDEEDDEELEKDDAEKDDEEDEELDDEEDEGVPDFYEMAYEMMEDMYHKWDKQFKKDCIDYYLAHKDD